MTGRQAHRMGTTVLSLAMAVIGIALLAQALAGNGGLLSARSLLGVLFAIAGCGRLYILVKGGRKRAEDGISRDDSPTRRRSA